MLLTGNLLALPLLFAPRKFREPLLQTGISLICRTFLWGCHTCGIMRIELDALDQINQQHGMLLTPNHPSMIDAFLVLSRVRRMVCLMKASISSNLFLGIGAHLAGYVSNRHPDQMFRSAIQRVESGDLLLIFPEGTRSTQQPVSPLQGAAALIAKKAGVPLQSIKITTNSLYLSKGWKIWRPPVEFPMIYRAEPGPLFAPEERLEVTMSQLQDYYESVMTRSIDPDLCARKHPGNA